MKTKKPDMLVLATYEDGLTTDFGHRSWVDVAKFADDPKNTKDHGPLIKLEMVTLEKFNAFKHKKYPLNNK